MLCFSRSQTVSPLFSLLLSLSVCLCSSFVLLSVLSQISPPFSVFYLFPRPHCFGFSLIFPPPVLLSSPLFIGGKWGERGLLPLSSHGTGVGWSDGHWAAISGPLAGLVPSVFSSCGRPWVKVWASGGLCRVCFWVLGKKGRGADVGEHNSSSPASACVCRGRRRTHSTIPNSTVLSFFFFLSFF